MKICGYDFAGVLETISYVNLKGPISAVDRTVDIASIDIKIVIEHFCQEITAEADVVPMKHTADAAEHIDTPIIGILRSKP